MYLFRLKFILLLILFIIISTFNYASAKEPLDQQFYHSFLLKGNFLSFTKRAYFPFSYPTNLYPKKKTDKSIVASAGLFIAKDGMYQVFTAFQSNFRDYYWGIGIDRFTTGELGYYRSDTEWFYTGYKENRLTTSFAKVVWEGAGEDDTHFTYILGGNLRFIYMSSDTLLAENKEDMKSGSAFTTDLAFTVLPNFSKLEWLKYWQINLMIENLFANASYTSNSNLPFLFRLGTLANISNSWQFGADFRSKSTTVGITYDINEKLAAHSAMIFPNARTVWQFGGSYDLDIGVMDVMFSSQADLDWGVQAGFNFAWDVDKCPDEEEDYDGFQDDDGCPDPDNDEDGILDIDDKCPNEKEVFNGVDDLDGCPEIDDDLDGIIGEADLCPDKKEDFDGFEDTDGCPESDNDEDGLLDIYDKCPNEAENINYYKDGDGCPDLLFEDLPTLSFDGSTISGDSYPTLAEIGEFLENHQNLQVAIVVYVKSTGKDKRDQQIADERLKNICSFILSNFDFPEEQLAGKGKIDPD